MTPFPNASKDFHALNPHLANPQLSGDGASHRETPNDAVRAELEPSDWAGNVGEGEAEEADSGRFLVRVESVRRILLDEDNLCEKYAVDCCRYAGCLPNDRPGQTKIEVGQRKAEKGEQEHTLVEIFAL